MSETTSNTTDQTTDERARTWAFTALALSLAALLGGGTLTNGVQSLFLESGSVGRVAFSLTLVAAPVLMSVVAMWLGGNAVASDDSLARPVGRAAQTISGLAILGAVLVAAAASAQSNL